MRILTPCRVYPFALVAFLALFISGCTLPREYEAALLLADIAAGPGKTFYKTMQPKPGKRTVTFTAKGVSYSGDLYSPQEKPLAALLLLPGAAEQGKDDPRLQALATSMARARFVVLVPDLTGFRTMQISSSDIGDVARCFQWLESRPELSNGNVGICAFSYACGPAVLAALDPTIRERINFVITIGGYHDLSRALTFFTTGYFQKNKVWLHREPNHYGKWVFVLSNISRLSVARDRALFKEMAARKLENILAGTDDLAAGLTAEGSSVYAFIQNRDPARVPFLIGKLPAAIQEEIRDLNVAAYDLGPLKARMIIIHGYDDDIIPYTESIALAGKVTPEQVRLYLVQGLMHVDLRPTFQDKFRLWRAISALLKERGRGRG